ncbi:MAG: hypothetical protein U1E10_15520 [Bdellovibrionales bacterium]|nr:hypothetical protein [Bdellovibrionales bacterium]
MKTKLVLLLATVLVGSVSMVSEKAAAQLAPVPVEIADCWTESGMDIEDGEFIVQINTGKVTKAQLIKILSGLSGRNITPVGYPLFFDKSTFVHVKAADYGVGAHRLSREDLKMAVYLELTEVLTYGAAKKDYGTSAACNHRAYPAPAVGVRN